MLASPLSIVVCEHYIFSTALSIFYFSKFSQRISVKKENQTHPILPGTLRRTIPQFTLLLYTNCVCDATLFGNKLSQLH